jgi:hypothetical protein
MLIHSESYLLTEFGTSEKVFGTPGVGASGKILRTSEVCNRYSNIQTYTGNVTT